jgi:(2R)-sulfolactate sulfo-lyase subunit alpha
MTGLVMEDGSSVRVTALDDIPLGHKVALSDVAKGETVIKYGHDIGETVAAVRAGGHVHVHNMKTKRW